MNFDFYIFGTPNGHKQYPSNSNEVLFKSFAQVRYDNSQMIMYRENDLVYYSYIRYLSASHTDNYFGISVIFNNVYCVDTEKFFNFFADTFDYEVSKGEILEQEKDGGITFVTDNFRNTHTEVEKLRISFQNFLDSQSNYDLATLDKSFEYGNKSTKELSLLDGNEIISATFRKYQKVIIAPNSITVAQRKRKRRMQFSIVSVLLGLAIGLCITFIVRNHTQKGNEKIVAEKNEIMLQTKAVRDSINVDIVFWDEYGQDYHLFKNCSNVSDNTESTVEQAFEQSKKQLCEECKNNVAKYKEYRKNARDYYNAAIDLQDEKYYNRAFDYCDSLLMMRPDNKRINDIKQEIETRRK